MLNVNAHLKPPPSLQLAIKKPLRGIFSAGNCTEKTDSQDDNCWMMVAAAPRSVGRAQKEALSGGKKKTTKK